MREIWEILPAVAQDIVIALGLLLPLLALGAVLLRGYRPWPLVRALLWRFRWSNVLFVLLIAVSVGMGIGLISQERGLRDGMARAADKFDLVVAAPGSEMTLMLAAVFLQPSDVPLLNGEIFNEIAAHERVKIAAPIAFGDSYGDAPVVGTIASFVRHLTDDEVQGRMWATSSEAIAGAAVPLDIGDRFTPAHGAGDAADSAAHDGVELEIVGRMARTGTPWDRSILVPVESVWEVHGLANGHAPERGDQIGPPFDARYFPGTPAIIVKAEELWASYALRSDFTRDNETMAFFPGTILSNLYRVMGDVRQAMSIMSIVTQILVGSSVLLGLFILSRLFQRQIGMLRAIGAPRRFVMSVVWLYGVALLTAGTLAGLVFGLASVGLISQVVTERTDVLVQAGLGWSELHLALSFLLGAGFLSLLPAWAVMRQPIVDSLRS